MQILKNDILKIEINEHGAELSSVFGIKSQKEYLWQGDKQFWGRRSPVLFPVVGKYKNLKSVCDGKEYSLPQHGFARDCDFTLIQKTENSVSFELKENSDTLKNYPFKFRLVCSFELTDNKIRVKWSVTNTNDCEMYFSIGAHPAFNCEKGKTVLSMNKDNLEYSVLNAEGLYLPKKYPLESSFVLTDDIFDRDALIIENSGITSVQLLNDGKEFVTVNFTAPLFGIWSPVKKNAPFVCIEPWYGRADAADFDCDLTNREWGNRLLAGETFKKEYEIVINE
ncbi:MAG: aldose 1-epimerase family protein [Oscillospiraceae bacterium]|nr:aldose 1-epimerase family protein [Oscillospiraceae bacterium]